MQFSISYIVKKQRFMLNLKNLIKYSLTDQSKKRKKKKNKLAHINNFSVTTC